jgi:high-affinity iron transporter
MCRISSRIVIVLLALALFPAASALAQGSSLAEQVRSLEHHAKEGVEAAERNQPDVMRAEYEELHTLWQAFEDGVRTQDAAGYVEIEGALAAIKAALAAEPLDPGAVRAAYTHLGDEAWEVAERLGGAAAGAPLAQPAAQSPASLLEPLGAARAAVGRGDTAAARTEIDELIRAWPAVEGTIATQDQDAYTAIEVGLGRAAGAIKAEPADLAAAATALQGLEAAIAPFARAQSYTALDAAALILREGLEALLVIVALLAFLRRSGNADKRRWIWVGGALGVLASVVVAVLLQAIFSRVSAGQNRELIEGATGLVAAALLFYVSYWLHSKASLHAWQGYINARTTRALARGSLLGLALLSFLAVFREGAETVVFYLGMAPSIALADLMLGLGIGVAVLIVAAVLMLVVGVKLPLRPFFRIAGLLVYYLGFKFVGTGIHALQVAGLLPTSPIEGVPAVPFLGFYPTWQTALAQFALLLGALAAFLYLRARDRRVALANASVAA